MQASYRRAARKIDLRAQILHRHADIQNVATQIAVHRSEHPAAAPCSPAKVLVVDDDADFRALARRILETGGFDVREAATASECLQRLRSYPTDLVILDIVLPDRDGIEALAEIRTLYPKTRILTIAGAENCELYLRVSSYLGADASLDKSRIASLCSLLKVVLDR